MHHSPSALLVRIWHLSKRRSKTIFNILLTVRDVKVGGTAPVPPWEYRTSLPPILPTSTASLPYTHFTFKHPSTTFCIWMFQVEMLSPTKNSILSTSTHAMMAFLRLLSCVYGTKMSQFLVANDMRLSSLPMPPCLMFSLTHAYWAWRRACR